MTLGTALTFVTLAIPVQLESNWITIGWGQSLTSILHASRLRPLIRIASLPQMPCAHERR